LQSLAFAALRAAIAGAISITALLQRALFPHHRLADTPRRRQRQFSFRQTSKSALC
jgi:hypothetical protein